jgi:hypothetical protein
MKFYNREKELSKRTELADLSEKKPQKRIFCPILL